MEFNTRGFQRNRGREEAPTASRNSGTGFDTILSASEKEPKKKNQPPKTYAHKRRLIVVFISAVALLLLLAAITGFFSKGEAALIEKDKHQVVALTDDRAFFGKITKFSDQYIVLEDVFYLDEDGEASSTSAAQLIKRGCEAWRPTDRMVIYRSNILFWENIDSEGQVAKIIAQWEGQYPDGQKCNTTNPSATQEQTAPSNNGGATSESGL